MIEAFFFWVMAFGAVGSAVAVIVNRNPVRSAVALIFTLMFIAGLFVLLGAHFLAAAEVIVYVGAILVLFLFVVMLLNLGEEELGASHLTLYKFMGGVVVATCLIYYLADMDRLIPLRPWPAIDSTYGTIESVGRLLLTKYLFPFELVSFLLLAAIVGAVVIAKRRL